MAHAVGKRVTARLALARLIAGAEAAVEDSMESWRPVFELVEISLVRLKLGDGDNLLRRKDGELDVFTEGGEEREGQPPAVA